MTAKSIHERVVALRSLGLDPATVDPTYEAWSNGERGKLHLDLHCYKLNSSMKVKRSVQISETVPGRFCDVCIDHIMRLNTDLKNLIPVVSIHIEMTGLERVIREDSVTNRLTAQRRLISLRDSLEDLSEKAVETHTITEIVRAEIERALSDAQTFCSIESTEDQLLRVLAFSLLVDPRHSTVISEESDSALFGSRCSGDLIELHQTWRNSYEATSDRSEALGATLKIFFENSRPTSWSQMNFIVENSVVSGNLADYTRKLWKERAESTLRRLCGEWADSVDKLSNSKERNHLVVFQQRFEPEDEFAAITAIYKVAEAEGYVAVQAPALVATYFQRMSTYNWQISNVELFKGSIRVEDIRTALTLYSGTKSIYSNFEEAFKAACLL
jgi:hypothetical protein